MSVLEIVLYVIIGTATVAYITLSIIKMIKEKKNKKKDNNSKKDESSRKSSKNDESDDD